MIDAYLMAVAGAENRAAGRGRRPQSRDESRIPNPDSEADRGPRGHVPGRRRTMGIARGRRSRLSKWSARAAQPAHLFQSGERVEIRLHVRANQRVSDFCVRRRHLQRRRCLLLRHEHADRRWHRGRVRRDGRSCHLRDRRARSRGAGRYKLDVAVHRQDGVPYDLSPAALYVPREVTA